MVSVSRLAATDEELADNDEKFDEELRAARRSWWGGLVGIELMIIMVLLPLPMLFGPKDAVAGNQQFLQGADHLQRWLRLVGSRAENGYSPFEPLAILATIGIAAAVALNAAHGRFDRARSNVRAREFASRREVFDAQHAMSGSAAVFLVTFLALFLAHLLAIGAILVALDQGGQKRAEACVAAILAVLMGAFLLVECARLLAPWRSPHRIQPRGHVKKVQARLALVVAKTSQRTHRIAILRVALGVMIGSMAVFSKVAAGSSFAGAVIAVSLFLVLAGVAVARMAASAVFEVGAMRGLTIGYPILLVAALWVSFTAAIASSLLQVPERRWVLWALVVLATLWVLFVAVIVVRILGQASIGWARVYGLRFAGLVELPVPRRRRSFGRDLMFALAVIGSELVVATPVILLPATGTEWGRALVSGGTLVAAGLAVVTLAAFTWASRLCVALGDHIVRVGRSPAWAAVSAVAFFAGVYFVASATVLERTGEVRSLVVVLPALIVHGVLLLEALRGVRRRLPIRRVGRLFWIFRFVSGVSSRMGGDALGALVDQRRRLVSRSLSSGERWGDAQVLEWWRRTRSDSHFDVVATGLARSTVIRRLRSGGMISSRRE